jgi:hypothetical protein
LRCSVAFRRKNPVASLVPFMMLSGSLIRSSKTTSSCSATAPIVAALLLFPSTLCAGALDWLFVARIMGVIAQQLKMSSFEEANKRAILSN